MFVHTVILIITCSCLIGSLSSWLALFEWRWSVKVSDSRKQSEGPAAQRGHQQLLLPKAVTTAQRRNAPTTAGWDWGTSGPMATLTATVGGS